MNLFFKYIKSFLKRKILFKTRQNQEDLENFKVLKLTKPVDNCNNFKLRRVATVSLALGWIFLNQYVLLLLISQDHMMFHCKA